MAKYIQAWIYFAIAVLTTGPCLSQEYSEQFDKIVAPLFTETGPGGTLLVSQDGKVLYRKAFGKADIALDVPMKPEHVFRIGSITKQFTAAAILKLAEEGKLSLEDGIDRFIKDYPSGHAITIKHLLTHTSGIRNYTSLPAWTATVRRTDLTPTALIDLFKNEPNDFMAGQEFRYSNSGYILLGYIIELVSGKSYSTYIEENFLGPLGMKNSVIENTSTIIPLLSSGYQYKNGHTENAGYLSMTLPYAAGAMVSNADDLLTWNEAVMQGRVLNSKSLKEAQTSYRLSNGMATGYGYGWEIGNIQGARSVKHTGRINGFVSYAVYLPDVKVFVSILSNCECTGDLETPASKIAAVVLGKPYQFTTMNIPVRDMEIYPGIYQAEDGRQRIVALEDERLLTFIKGGTKTQLLSFQKDQFNLANTITAYTFMRDNAGNILSFSIQDNGIPTVWKRVNGNIKKLKSMKALPREADSYVGKYQFDRGPVFEIVKEGDKLYGQVGTDKKEILPVSKYQFFAKDIDAYIIFNVDKLGRVVSLTKIQSDSMEAKKIEIR